MLSKEEIDANWAEAIRTGARTFEGKECVHGHGNTRSVSGKRPCVECRRLNRPQGDENQLTKSRGNRAAAKRSGERWYQGLPCHKGHPGVRRTSTMMCRDCETPLWRAKQQAKQNRDEAIARGENTFEGMPCRQGHRGLRYVGDGLDCVDCSKERNRRITEAMTPSARADAAAEARNRKKKDPAHSLLMSSRQRALRSGREHTLKLKDIPPIPDRCPVLGIKLVVGADWANRLSAPSLDRVDNTKGYVPGNVQVLSLRANNMKNDSTIEELELVLAYMKAHAA